MCELDVLRGRKQQYFYSEGMDVYNHGCLYLLYIQLEAIHIDIKYEYVWYLFVGHHGGVCSLVDGNSSDIGSVSYSQQKAARYYFEKTTTGSRGTELI